MGEWVGKGQTGSPPWAVSGFIILLWGALSVPLLLLQVEMATPAWVKLSCLLEVRVCVVAGVNGIKNGADCGGSCTLCFGRD